MKLKVLPPVQVCHAGKVYRPGETAEVPDEVGQGWPVSEWVEPADASSKRAEAVIDTARDAQAVRLAAGGESAPAAPAERAALAEQVILCAVALGGRPRS